MKITNNTLKTTGAFICAIGTLVSIFFKEAQNYIIICSVILGMIVMMPWISEKEDSSK
jgi:short-subunit dehydrogenase involved in D-alanine esterification of teichoic acids